MRDSAQMLAENANPGSDQLVGRDRPAVPRHRQNSHDQPAGKIRPLVRSTPVLMRRAKAVWPQKTAMHLSFITGQTLRAAERQLSGDREMGAEAFVALLRSHEGFAFLEAVMTAIPAPARPGWWRKLSRSASRAELRRQQAALASRIDAIDQEEQLDLELRLGWAGSNKQGETR